MKFKLFWLKYNKIIYIIIFILFIIFLSKVSFKTLMPDDPTKIGVIGTLLGAIVGGVLSLVGSVYINNKQIVCQAEIKRKNIIYRPLYDELLDNKKIIEVENRYPGRVSYQKGQQTVLRHPCIAAWNRICSDSRILDTPKILKIQYQKYLKTIDNYVKIRNSANEKVQKIINETMDKELNEINVPLVLSSSLVTKILDNTFNGKELASFYSFINKNIEEEKWSMIANKIMIKCNDIEELKNIRDSFQNWIEIQDETIELLELLIREVNIKCEKQKG